jgi:hypothetical protein
MIQNHRVAIDLIGKIIQQRRLETPPKQQHYFCFKQLVIRHATTNKPVDNFFGSFPNKRHFIVGITNSAPERMPVGQRAVTVLSLV